MDKYSNTMDLTIENDEEVARTLLSMSRVALDDEETKILSQCVKRDRDKYEADLKRQASGTTTNASKSINDKRPARKRTTTTTTMPSTSRTSPVARRPRYIASPNGPRPGYSIDGTRLPSHPPCPGLRDIIGRIAEPFEKQLTPSDVAGVQCRLALVKSFVVLNYLPMLRKDENVCSGVPVTVYGPDGGEHNMDLKFWAGKTYVITNKWMTFVKNYGLQEYIHWMTVWMFRHKATSRLCFALNWKLVPHTTELIKR